MVKFREFYYKNGLFFLFFLIFFLYFHYKIIFNHRLYIKRKKIMNDKIIRSIKRNYIKNLKKLIKKNNDIVYNKDMYEAALNKNNFEALQILCENDNRGNKAILDDLFHLLNENNKTVNFESKSLVKQKIKNKELNISIIDTNFLYNLENIKEIKENIILIIETNKLHTLNNYLMKNNTLISYINDDNFDLLIYLISHNYSLDVIKNIVSYYRSLNYVINDRTPLFYAIFKSRFSIAKLLLQHGADINFKINDLDIVSIFFDDYYDSSYKLYYTNRIEIKHENYEQILKFILSHVRFINSSRVNNWIIRKIKDNSVHIIESLKMVINYYNSFNDISNILRLLIIYKNKIRLNNEQFDNALQGYWSFPVEWLNCAIDFNNEDILRYMIECKANVNGYSENGDCPLYKALKRGKSLKGNDQNIIKCLEDKANPNIVFKNGETPLNYAIQYCYGHVIDNLIKNGANIHRKDSNGNTPLIYAVKKGNMKLIKYFIRHKADINVENKDGKTPLSIAVSNDNLEILKYLIDKKAKINKKNKYGKTILDIAIEEKYRFNDQIIKYLMDLDAKIGNYSCLALAVEKKFDESIIIYLVEHGAYINGKNFNGKTPLDISINNYDKNITEYLIECGAEINDPLSLVNAIELEFSEKTIKYIIDQNVDINVKSVDGDTPLIFSIMNEREYLIKLLIENGAKLKNDDNISEESPLTFMIRNNFKDQLIIYILEHGLGVSLKRYLSSEHLNVAINMSNTKLVKYFIDKGVDINIDSKLYGTPLINAIRNRNENMISFLIEHGANINKKSKFYGSPLINTMEYFSEPFIKNFIEQGANVNICYLQNSPLSYAVKNCSEELIQYLINHGVTTYSGIVLSTAIERRFSEMIIIDFINHGVELNKNSVLVKLLENNYSDYLIKYAIDHGADINEKNENDKLPIVIAIQKRRKNIIKYLIDHNVKIDELDEENKLFIVCEVEQENEKILNFLYDKNKNINENNKFTFVFGKNFKESIVKYLVENDKNININEYLEEAIKNGYSDDLIKSLIEYTTNYQQINYSQLVHYAMKRNSSEEIIKLLLEKCNTIENNGDSSILNIAIECCSEKIIKSIIDHGVDVNMNINFTKSPIDLAIENCGESIVKYLIDHGASISKNISLITAIEKKYGESLIDYLIKHGANVSNGPILAKLIEKRYSNNLIKQAIINGADTNKGNENNETPLILSISNNNEEIIKYLIENGADTNRVGQHSKPPLDYAIENNNESIVNYLIQHKAYINRSSITDYFPLMNSILCNNFSISKCLINNGATKIFRNSESLINLVCKKSFYSICRYIIYMTNSLRGYDEILHYAIKYEKINFVKYLIDKFKCDYKSLECAIGINNEDLIKFLFHCRQSNYILSRIVKSKSQEMLKCIVDYVMPLDSDCLMGIVHIRDITLIKYLIEKFGDLLKEIHQGSILFEAGILKNYNLLIELLNYGITIDGEDKFYTILYIAIRTGFQIIDYLLNNVMSINDVNEDKETLLIILLTDRKRISEKTELIKYLIDKGADVNCRNMYGETALSLAKQNSSKMIMNYMIKHGAKE